MMTQPNNLAGGDPVREALLVLIQELEEVMSETERKFLIAPLSRTRIQRSIAKALRTAV